MKFHLKKEIKVSVITVTYNSSKTIFDTLISVLSQSYYNIEYIVVDGASMDNTISILKKFETEFSGRLKWISEPDLGIYDAMNKGLRMATGDIIGILNSDDFLLDSDVIQDIVCAFDDSIDAIFGNLYFVKESDTNSIVRLWRGSPYRSFCSGWHPAHPTFYVRRYVYDKYGTFDTSFSISADFELMLRFIEKYHIRTKYIDRYIVKMRLGGESTGSLMNMIKGNKNIMRAFRKNEISVSWLYPFMRIFPKILNLLKYKLKLSI